MKVGAVLVGVYQLEPDIVIHNDKNMTIHQSIVPITVKPVILGVMFVPLLFSSPFTSLLASNN